MPCWQRFLVKASAMAPLYLFLWSLLPQACSRQSCCFRLVSIDIFGLVLLLRGPWFRPSPTEVSGSDLFPWRSQHNARIKYLFDHFYTHTHNSRDYKVIGWQVKIAWTNKRIKGQSELFNNMTFLKIKCGGVVMYLRGKLKI